MQASGLQNPSTALEAVGIKGVKTAHWNLSPEALIEHTIIKGMGELTDTGALSIHTGEFTGRSPEDRFIVKDSITQHKVNWGKVNLPFDPKKFDSLWRKACQYLKKKEVYVRDAMACASAG